MFLTENRVEFMVEDPKDALKIVQQSHIFPQKVGTTVRVKHKKTGV